MRQTNVKGVVFDVQRYSIHDGPGIRTLVFMKGCPLRCVWCQNIESQQMQPQIMFNSEKCGGCGQCALACTSKGIKVDQGRSITDRKLCNNCGKCVEVCPNEARGLVGREMSIDDVFSQIQKDIAFYKRSGGGATLSGGEPSAQPEFVIKLLEKCQKAGIHTTMETCGYTKWEILKRLISHAHLILYDIKLIDSEEHLKLTGVPNKQILDNAIKIARLGRKHRMVVRVPVIPGYTDSIENMKGIAEFISTKMGTSVRFELLNYNPLGETKGERLGTNNGVSGLRPLADEQLDRLIKIFESYGLKRQ